MLELVRAISIALLALSLAAATPAAAATFQVTKTADTNDGLCNADCSLREAVQAANATPAADVINLPAGTYRLSRGGSFEDFGATGDLDVLRDLEIRGAGATMTTIDANGIDRAVDAVAGTLRLAQLTLRGGRLTNAADVGGGVRVSALADVTLDNVVIADNRLSTGASTGGGIANAGTLTVIETTVRDNRVEAAGAVGGGIANAQDATATILRSTIRDNRTDGAACGGGGISNSGDMMLTNSTISSNHAECSAAAGGGISNSANLTASHVTISGNTVNGLTGVGGAITNSGTARFDNSIIGGRCAGLNLTSMGGNIESPASGCGFGGNDQDSVSAADLALGPLADNGGPTSTHGLGAGSVAIDTAASGSCPAVDQRNVNRPRDGDGDGTAICDVGAVEVGSGSPPPGPCTPTATAMCLQQGRFRVEVDFRGHQNETGAAEVVQGVSSPDSGLFYFFNANNWEMLVKVIDACSFNDRFWVYAGATTDIQYTLRVTDTQSGQFVTYFNPLGNAAAAITDSSAFATCP